MGCQYSGCMGSTLTEAEFKARTNTRILNFHSKNLVPSLGNFFKKNEYDSANVVEDVILSERPLFSARTAQPTTDRRYSYPRPDDLGLPLNSDNPLELEKYQLRYGKTIDELHFEYLEIVQSLIDVKESIYRSYAVPECSSLNPVETFITIFEQWKAFVYDDICRQTGEVKNFLSYDFTGKNVRILHEVDGWKRISTLKDFCENMGLKIDENFFNEMKDRMESVGSLTVYVYLDVYDTLPEPEIKVGFSLTKATNRRSVEDFLGNSNERGNLLMWFDANKPIPIEYGFSVDSNGTGEMIMGFYFFDGKPKENLERSLNGFQAYGAKMDERLKELLDCSDNEEYKIYFHIKSEGVCRVKLAIRKLKEDTEDNIIENIYKRENKRHWKEFNRIFEPLVIKRSHFLEFSQDGFELSCISEMGNEVRSRVFLHEEDYD